MNNEYKVKRNSIIESNIKASVYKPLIDFLKRNLDKLADFVISEKEILQIVSSFDYESFRIEFKEVREFRNLQFIRSPFSSKIYHVLGKNLDIPADYTRDVIKTLVENEYDTKGVKEIIGYWKSIYKSVAESFKNHTATQTGFLQNNFQKQSENYSTLNVNIQSLDGTYGTHIYKDRDSGRFYSVPSYDNYSDESNS